MQLEDSPHPLEHNVEVLDAVGPGKGNVQRVHHELVDDLFAAADGSGNVISKKLPTHLVTKLHKFTEYCVSNFKVWVLFGSS